MPSIEKKSLDSPDETRPFDSGEACIVTLSGATIGRATLQPGWKWSEFGEADLGDRKLPGFTHRVRALGSPEVGDG